MPIQSDGAREQAEAILLRAQANGSLWLRRRCLHRRQKTFGARLQPPAQERADHYKMRKALTIVATLLLASTAFADTFPRPLLDPRQRPERHRASRVLERSTADDHGYVPRCRRDRCPPDQVTVGIAQASGGGSVFTLCELITARISASGLPETRASSAKVDPFFRAPIIWKASITDIRTIRKRLR